MNDDETLEALRTGLLAADAPPAGLRDAAVHARFWGGSGEVVAAESAIVDEFALRDGDAITDRQFIADQHTVDVAIEPGGHHRIVSGAIHPPVGDVTIVVPGEADRRVACDPMGTFRFESTAPAVALRFNVDGRAVRTPLIDLF